MPRKDRLFDLLNLLRDGRVHKAHDLASHFGLSVRTIYRDMDQLIASGVPVKGTRGEGYQIISMTTLPPLPLSETELSALHLGLAIVAQAGDAELSDAARDLSDKVDAALPEVGLPESEAWKTALTPFTDAAKGLSHVSVLRAAIKARQKVAITIAPDRESQIVRPLRLDVLGQVWILTGWNENAQAFAEFRLDLITEAQPQQELFEDTPGMRLEDFKTDRQTVLARRIDGCSLGV